MQELIFAAVAYKGRSELYALMFARSIRTFGGRLADSPIWMAVPRSVNQLTPQVLKEFEKIDVKLVPFPLSDKEAGFAFAPKTIAAGFIEEQVAGEAEVLAWLDNNCFVFNQPDAFLLPEGISLGYRPVDHRNIGSLYDEPLDPFWAQIYQDCDVPPDAVFPMKPAADTQILRPYFNAGISIVWPERGILQAVSSKFKKLFRNPEYKGFYEDSKYQVFMHQAVYSAEILQMLSKDEMLELPREVNYSLFLHDEYAPGDKAAYLDELISARHEGFPEEAPWLDRIGIREPLRSWFNDQAAFVEGILHE